MKFFIVYMEKDICQTNTENIADGLIAKLSQELNRPVSQNIAELSRLAVKGLGHGGDSLFFDISEPYAYELMGWIKKDNSKFAESFKKHVAGKDVIDLGCGCYTGFNSLLRCDMEYLQKACKELGAKRYIGVDLYPGDIKARTKNLDGFEEVYVKDEILSFLAKLPDPTESSRGKMFFLSAIEPCYDFESERMGNSEIEFFGEEKERVKRAIEYMRNFYDELSRATKKSDAVLFLPSRARAMHALDCDYQMPKRGFKYENLFFVKE